MRFLKLVCLITASIAAATPVADPLAAALPESELVPRARHRITCDEARKIFDMLTRLYRMYEVTDHLESAKILVGLLKKGQDTAESVC
ncbi:hypothetical protein ACJZ2D_000239 [Fusarium nematophilum]